MRRWQKISSHVIHKNPWYSVRRDQVVMPNGQRGVYHVVDSPDAVFVVAMNDEREVCFVEQHRYPTGLVSIEIPAGGSDGQPPLRAAKRELQEEAGLQARRWQRLGILQTANGMLSEAMHVYLATQLKPAPSSKQAEEGIRKVTMIPLHRALLMVKRGQITCAQTVAALLLVAQELNLV